MKKILLILVVLLNIFLVGCSGFGNISYTVSAFEGDIFYKVDQNILKDNSVAVCFGYYEQNYDIFCRDVVIKVYVDDETNPIQIIEISNDDLKSMMYKKLVDKPNSISDYSNPFYFNVLDYDIKQFIKIELSNNRYDKIDGTDIKQYEEFLYLYMEGEIIENQFIVSSHRTSYDAFSSF